LAKIY